jgi:hypothetical protein
MRSSR